MLRMFRSFVKNIFITITIIIIIIIIIVIIINVNCFAHILTAE